MFGFPQTTEFNKRIPKQKFYDNMDISPSLKRVFAEQIRLIYWRNKLAASTMKIEPGKTVTEVEVLELKLTDSQLNEAALRLIDREIPYHILFILSFEGRVQAWTGHKEALENGETFRVNRYFHTEWMPEAELNFKVEGLNMDAVWENLIIQVGSVEVGQGRSLDEQLRLNEQRAKLQKEIERLEAKAWREKQPNKRYQLVHRARELKAQLKETE